MIQTMRLLKAALLIPLLGVTACDPFTRPGTWNPARLNDANLAAMAAYPADLTAGQGEPDSLGAEAVPAVQRLLTDRRRPLPKVNASTLQDTTDQPAAGNGNVSAQP